MNFKKAIEMLESGAPCESVADLIGCEPGNARNKVNMWPELRAARDAGRQRIADMLMVDGIPAPKVAEMTGRSKSAIRAILKRERQSRGRTAPPKKMKAPKPAPINEPWNGEPQDTLINRVIMGVWA